MSKAIASGHDYETIHATAGSMDVSETYDLLRTQEIQPEFGDHESAQSSAAE